MNAWAARQKQTPLDGKFNPAWNFASDTIAPVHGNLKHQASIFSMEQRR